MKFTEVCAAYDLMRKYDAGDAVEVPGAAVVYIGPLTAISEADLAALAKLGWSQDGLYMDRPVENPDPGPIQ